MPRGHSMHVRYPSGGENRRGGYAQKGPTFTTPRAYNVRSVGPLEKRGRGGSRPPLAKYVDNDFGTNITGMASVTYLDNSGNRQHDLAVIADGYLSIVRGASVTTTTAYLTTDAGDKITDSSGNYLTFQSTVASVNPLTNSNAFQMVEWGGKLYIADSTLRVYNPLTGAVSPITAAPANQPLICVYQERVVLAGADHMFYQCGQTEPANWDAGADMGDEGRSIMGFVGDSGVMGEKILAMHPHHDRALVFGCQDSVWAVYGNMAGNDGQKKNVSPHAGILAPKAMSVTPNGLVIFLSRSGLYTWQVGSNAHPEPFSSVVIPEELLDVDTDTTEVLMQYDHRSRGVHLFLTPDSGVGTHWWIDIENKAIWPVKIQATMQPLATAKLLVGGFSNIILGCKDGYLRRFDDSAADDDGGPLYSHILLGPLHIGREEGSDGLLTEMMAAMAEGSGDVKIRIITGDTAEAAVDAADAALALVIDSQYA